MYMLHVHVHVHVHVNVHARRYMYSCTKFHAKFRDDLWHRSVRFQWPRFRESEYESVPKLEKFLLKWHGFDWRCTISRFCFDFDWWRRYELPYFKKWLVQSRKIYTGTLEIRKRGTRYRSKSGNFISFFFSKANGKDTETPWKRRLRVKFERGALKKKLFLKQSTQWYGKKY